MQNCYNKNGLVFWTEAQIKAREAIKIKLVDTVSSSLKRANKAFEIIQVEAPLLTPKEYINPNYSDNDYYSVNSVDTLVLRPETTMGSYAYAKYLLENQTGTRLPLCIWQHGKSFRREQDQPTKFMRLKEFYQLEFQIIYGLSTANDYSIQLIPQVAIALADIIGDVRIEPSDRLPTYAEWTKDIICKKSNMEVCSISSRKDFENAKVLEIALGTDRLIYNYLEKMYNIAENFNCAGD